MARPEHYRVKAMMSWLQQTAKLHPIFVFRTHQTGKTKKGIPDIYICFYGVSLWVEAKKDQDAEATEIQKERMKQIRDAMGYAICTSMVVDIRAAMQRILNDNAGRFICAPCRIFVHESCGIYQGLPGLFCPQCLGLLRKVPSATEASFPKITSRAG